MLCNKRQESPSEGFSSWPINEALAGLVAEQPQQILRGPVAENLRAGLVALQNLVMKMAFEIDNGEHEIKEYCIELRRLVQLATEEEIEKINIQNEQLIEIINAYEKKFIENLSSSSSSCLANLKQPTQDLIGEAKVFIEQQEAYLSQLQLKDQTTTVLNQKLEDISDQIRSQQFRVKKSLFNGNQMTFARDQPHVTKPFG